MEFLSALDDPTAGVKDLLKIARRVRDPADRSHRSFNLFDGDDLALFEAIVASEYTISAFQNRHVRAMLPGKWSCPGFAELRIAGAGPKTSGQISRMLKRLRTHGPIKKIGKTYNLSYQVP